MARCSRSSARSCRATSPARAEGTRAETAGTGDTLQSCIAWRTADPVLNFDSRPQQGSVMRGSCLTQNGAWSRSQKDRERCTQVEGGRERAAHRGLIYPLSDFSSPLFCFPFAETIALSSDTSLCPACRHLASPEWRRAAISGHHRRCRYGFVAAGTSRIPGGKNAGQGFNESEASSPGEKCMQMICTHQKDPG